MVPYRSTVLAQEGYLVPWATGIGRHLAFSDGDSALPAVQFFTPLGRFQVSASGLQQNRTPYNRIDPAFSRFLKAITDPIEDVLPALSLLHHQVGTHSKSYLLDFPTRIEFSHVDRQADLFLFTLPHLRHIHTLELSHSELKNDLMQSTFPHLEHIHTSNCHK